jgi:hypothetical protein
MNRKKIQENQVFTSFQGKENQRKIKEKFT